LLIIEENKMRSENKINMDIGHINQLIDEYSNEMQKDPPAYLKRKVMNRIEEEEAKQEHFFSRIISNIKYFLEENHTQALSFALSMMVLIIFSVGVLLNYVNEKEKSINNQELNLFMSSNIDSETIDDSSNDNAIPIKIYSAQENQDNTTISINGEQLPSNESNLLMELNNNYNHVKVNNGAISLQIENAGNITAYEGTIFKIDVYQREETLKDIYIIIEKGEMDINFIKGGEFEYEYYVEAPSAIINLNEESSVNVSVLDQDTIINVKSGIIGTFNNIRWNPEMTNEEMRLINKYVNTPEELKEGQTKIYVMEDVAEYSQYINQNYKRLIRQYIKD